MAVQNFQNSVIFTLLQCTNVYNKVLNINKKYIRISFPIGTITNFLLTIKYGKNG